MLGSNPQPFSHDGKRITTTMVHHCKNSNAILTVYCLIAIRCLECEVECHLSPYLDEKIQLETQISIDEMRAELR